MLQSKVKVTIAGGPSASVRKRNRPNQRPPVRGKAQGRKAADQPDDEDVTALLADYLGSPRRARIRQPGEKAEWEQRQEREHAAWCSLVPQLRAQYMCALRQLAHYKQISSAAAQQRVQELLNESWRFHACPCCRTAASFEEAGLQLLEQRPCEYISLQYRVPVSMPWWKCSTCQQQFSASPIHAGCFPRTPTCPEALYDLEVLECQ